MSLKTGKPRMRSAAWRISLWATFAFACGTLIFFIFLQNFVASDIQQRTDAWLSGEVEVLGDVAEHTPKNALYSRVVEEVAELATREVPNRLPSEDNFNDSVFFLQAAADGALKLWVGIGNGAAHLEAIRSTRIPSDHPTDLHVRGFAVPFRVVSVRLDDGSRIYLGLSERDDLRVLRNLRFRFFLLWLLLVLLGFSMVFFSTRRMLSHVRNITEAASTIGHSDLAARVPVARRHDEVSQLALTLNNMLDRIERSMHQLHTITDSLAHDLRSPLTAIRGKLESSLSVTDGDQPEAIVSAIEELDRLTDFLNKSLDVAEAKADALRLTRRELDLNDLLRAMIDLYEPSMSEKGLKVSLRSAGPLRVFADPALLHRMIANLLDNELKHLPPACTVTVELRPSEDAASLVLQDDGPGFDSEVLAHLFERRVRGRDSNGHGLGLAFVGAVAHAHGGTASAANRETRGARIVVTLPPAGAKTDIPGAAPVSARI
ncbi:MAG TPA: ATP-binding protein [Terracidiphilus sp.]|nr:ATP-binding protein [Terracidiphilus sp.]